MEQRAFSIGESGAGELGAMSRYYRRNWSGEPFLLESLEHEAFTVRESEVRSHNYRQVRSLDPFLWVSQGRGPEKTSYYSREDILVF